MAAIATPRAAGFGASLRPVSTVATFFGRLANWRDRRATRIALAKLSDHELSDIGLSRGDIDLIIR